MGKFQTFLFLPPRFYSCVPQDRQTMVNGMGSCCRNSVCRMDLAPTLVPWDQGWLGLRTRLTVPVAGRSIWTSTTSPSIISVSSLRQSRCEEEAWPPHSGTTTSHARQGSAQKLLGAGAPTARPRAHLMRTPMERRKACVSASVLLISKEKISLPAMAVNGVSGPRA